MYCQLSRSQNQSPMPLPFPLHLLWSKTLDIECSAYAQLLFVKMEQGSSVPEPFFISIDLSVGFDFCIFSYLFKKIRQSAYCIHLKIEEEC